jgi:hypothetical protein
MRTTIYVHACRDSMWDVGDKIGLKGDAARTFSYFASELALGIEVDKKTGKATIINVDGRAVAP